MNTTKSGSIAVGSPMSIARLQQEAEFYFSPSGTLEKFVSTDEGAAFVRNYISFIGGYSADDPAAFVDSGIESERLQYAVIGALIALRMTTAGRVGGKA